MGLKVDLRARLFVAGGPGGDGRVVNAITGKILASYSFASAPTFVNDVVLTPQAAWFTDTQRAVLYKVPFGRFGRLPSQGDVVRVPLRGAWAGTSANGIARTPDGKALLVIQSSTGLLFRVDPATGFATQVDLGGTLLLERRRAAPLRPHAVRRAEPAQPSRRRATELGGDVRRGHPAPDRSPLRRPDDRRRVRQQALPAERPLHDSADPGQRPTTQWQSRSPRRVERTNEARLGVCRAEPARPPDPRPLFDPGVDWAHGRYEGDDPRGGARRPDRGERRPSAPAAQRSDGSRPLRAASCARRRSPESAASSWGSRGSGARPAIRPCARSASPCFASAA